MDDQDSGTRDAPASAFVRRSAESAPWGLLPENSRITVAIRLKRNSFTVGRPNGNRFLPPNVRTRFPIVLLLFAAAASRYARLVYASIGHTGEVDRDEPNRTSHQISIRGDAAVRVTGTRRRDQWLERRSQIGAPLPNRLRQLRPTNSIECRRVFLLGHPRRSSIHALRGLDRRRCSGRRTW